MSLRRERATAFAPASVGNVAIGFDILGFAVDALGDRISVSRRVEPGVVITSVQGVAGELPREPDRNTAGRAQAKEMSGVLCLSTRCATRTSIESSICAREIAFAPHRYWASAGPACIAT